MSRLRLLRFSTRSNEVTVHEDGSVQAQREQALDPQARAQTEQAADIVERAHEQADALIRDGVEQAATAQHEAYREGREQGHRDGAAAARAELAEALALVQHAGRDAKTVRDHLLRGAEREIVELVIDSVRAVIGEQARLEPSLVMDTVERALKRAGSQNIVRIRVNPQNCELVSAQLVGRAGEVAANWEVTADGAIGVGGCVIDTEAGEVDARLDVQLDEIARAFRSAQDGETPPREGTADAA